MHFDHKALTRTGRGYFCKPCNMGVIPVWGRFGPVHARAAYKRVAVASGMRGVCCVLPLKEGT